MKKTIMNIPAKFEQNNFLEKIVALNEKYKENTIRIGETYGSFPKSEIGTALPTRNLYDLSKEKLTEYIKQSKSKDIEFNYVMNSIWSGGKEFTDDGYKKINEEIEGLLSCGVDRVSVSSPSLVKIIRRNFPELRVTVSINLCVEAIHPMKRWIDQGVCKIVPTRHINRDFELLEAMNKQCDVKLELLANSLCNLYCNLDKYHSIVNCCNSTIGESEITSAYPQSQCMYNIMKNPTELICSSWIRPEDMSIYENMEYHNFKLVGRCLAPERVLMIAEAYLSRDFNGNFFDLFDFISEEKNGFTMHLDNKCLDGLVESIKNGCGCRICGGNNSICKKISDEITYSNDKMAKMYKRVLAKELSKDSM